ncbi:MAG: response regulator [Spirochaetota bacterium]
MVNDYSIFNSMAFPVCVIGTDGQLLFLNSSFREIVNIAENESASLDLQHPFYPEYRKRIAIAYQRAREGEETKCFAVIRSAKGQQVPVEIYLYPIRSNDGSNDILAFFKFVENRVTSFDDSISPSSDSEMFENINIFEFSPFPILRFDRDLNVIALSASVEEITGCSREDILKRPETLFETFLPFDLERIKKHMTDVFSGNSTFKRVNDIKITTAKKQDKWANAVIYPVYREKKRILVEVLLEDITKIKFLENKLSVLNRVQIVGDLTKGLLHSFNNLTNVIINRSQMLQQLTEKKSVTDGLAIIQKSAIEGARQIRRIQDFISEKEYVNEHETGDLIDIVEDAIEFARIHFKVEKKDKGRNISIAKQYFAKDRVNGNIKILREIFVSMIFRVAGFIETQGVIETELKRDDDLFLSISTVLTPGSGSEERTSFQNPLSEIEIRRIADKINVRIFEESSSDCYTIKAVIPSSMIIEIPKDESEEEGIRIRDKDILVVEDDTALQEILFELFDSMGNRVSVCSNGTDAFNEFRNSKYDIVISDYGISGITGYELLKNIRELNEKVVTVLLSGWLLENISKYENTIDLFLSKPFHLDNLIREIAKVIARRN